MTLIPTVRTCTKCEEEKPNSEFQTGGNQFGIYFFKICRKCTGHVPKALSQTRVCIECTDEKLLADFSVVGNKSGTYYIKTCKTCVKRRNEPGPIRTCRVCEEPKPIEKFPFGKKGETNRRRVCHECCKAKARIRTLAYVNKNREAVRYRARLDRQIRYEKDPEFRKQQQARSREYYHKNKDQIALKKKGRNRKAS